MKRNSLITFLALSLVFSFMNPAAVYAGGSEIDSEKNQQVYVQYGDDGWTIEETGVGTSQQTMRIHENNGSITTVKKSGSDITVENDQSGFVQKIPLLEFQKPVPAAEVYKTTGNIPWEGPWRTFQSGYGTRSYTISTYATILSILAALSGVSTANSIIMSVASWYASSFLPEAYYHMQQQTRIWHGYVEYRTITKYYTSSDHSTLVPGSGLIYGNQRILHTVV